MRAQLTFIFSLVSAALARLMMQLMGTRLLDADVANVGIGIAAIAGALVGLLMHVLHTRDGHRKWSWLIVPIAGAMVGMTMQGLLLANKPEHRVYVIAQGISSHEPVSWILVGAPFGAGPALVAGALLFLAFRFARRSHSHDSRERTIVPLAAGCALLHAVELLMSKGHDLAIVALVLALAVLSLVQVIFADRARATWLANVWSGNDAKYSIEPLTPSAHAGIPLAVAGIAAETVVMGDVEAERASYRAPARAPYALAALTLEATLEPTRARAKVVGAVLGITLVTCAVALCVQIS